MSACPLGEEKSFSQRAFSIYTDIRKLQDKAKTSYTLSTSRPRFDYENSLAEVHQELVSEWSEENLPLTPYDISFGSNEKVWLPLFLMIATLADHRKRKYKFKS